MNAPSPVATLAIADITDADVEETIALWQRCGLTRPWNDPASDIALARRNENSTVLVGRMGGAVVATEQDRRIALFPRQRDVA